MSIHTLFGVPQHTSTFNPNEASRDVTLDGLRALAIIRVVTWHATGWAWTTWFISSVPAMFAISGALLANSFCKNGIIVTLRRRLTRLFPPLWIYSSFVLILSWRAQVHTSPIWTFFIPFDQPTSPLASYWLTSALWYLRAYMWVLVLSPILFFAVKRFGTLTPVVGSCLVAIIGWKSLDQSHLNWAIGDVVLYSTFASAGMLWLAQRRRDRKFLLLLGSLTLVGAIVWCLIRPTTSNVVNDDHLLHMLVGGFWTVTLLYFPKALTYIANTRVARYLNSYSLSIYLWHSIVAWTLWQLLPQWYPMPLRGVTVVSLTFALLSWVTYIVGFFEKYSWRLPPRKVLATRIIASVLLLIAFEVPSIKTRINLVRRTIVQPLPPSAAPTIVDLPINKSVEQLVNSPDFMSHNWLKKQEDLLEVLRRYDSQMKLGGTRAIVISPNGNVWHGLTSNARPFNEPSLIGSLTKTFTTSLIMRLVDKGQLSLDDQIGDLGIHFSHKEVTIRQLLTHKSGMPRFKSQSGRVPSGTTVSDVLKYISAQPLRFRPGTEIDYSTTGFAVLGALIEQKTGTSFDSLLKSELTRPLGYDVSTFVGDFGSIGFSTGGMLMKMDDLADWSQKYFFERSTSAQKWAWSIKQTTGVGVHGYCPCEHGNFMALGHIGGRTFASVDGSRTVVVIDTNGVLVNENYVTTQTMAQELRLIAGGGKKPLYIK